MKGHRRTRDNEGLSKCLGWNGNAAHRAGQWGAVEEKWEGRIGLGTRRIGLGTMYDGAGVKIMEQMLAAGLEYE